MRQVLAGLFFMMAGAIQAQSMYYVFKAAEDDCVMNQSKIEGEACLCIQVNAQTQEPLWKLNWAGLRCELMTKNEVAFSSVDCAKGNCTQRQCLVQLYDTQRNNSLIVSEKTCIDNNLPMLGF